MNTNRMSGKRMGIIWIVLFLLQLGIQIPVWGLSVGISSNHRYLVDKSTGKPFLIVGDCPQNLSNALPVSSTGFDMGDFYDECKAKGFNTLWVIIDGERGGPKDFVDYPPRDKAGQFMMNGPVINAHNRGWDITKLNPEYFKTIDAMIDLANQRGMLLLVMPLSECTWLESNIEANTNRIDPTTGQKTCWYTYGKFLGNRYKNKPNMIWSIGNDRINTPAQYAIVQGIKDAGDKHLMFAEWLSRTSKYSGAYKDVGSSWVRKFVDQFTDPARFKWLTGQITDPAYQAPFHKESWIDLDGWYQNWSIKESGAPCWWTKVEYQRMKTLDKTMPIFCCEAEYQQPFKVPGATDLECRMQNYYAVLGGACGGAIYGSGYLGEARKGETNPSRWNYDNYKNNGGRVQAIHFKKLFESVDWTSLVPDYSNQFVTSGKGTLSNTTMNYVGAAVNPAGTLGMAYVPLAKHKITVNMAKFSGPVTARWYDPTTGKYKAISGSPFSNSGSRSFTSPSTKHARLDKDPDPDLQGDWVLVLKK